MNFLTARWSNLCLFTYAVAPDRLQPYLPPGTRPDTIGDDAFVSLVAFDFLDTKVLGVSWPGFTNFAELNLRYYVQYDDPRTRETLRGVAFIREWVPQRLVAFLARTLYNEPYQAAPLTQIVRETDTTTTVEHELIHGGRAHRIEVVSDRATYTPPSDSTEHFFKEHRWGFGRTRNGKLLRYEVGHPVWEIHDVRSHRLDFDFEAVYGPEWAFLGDAAPRSVTHAVGSPVFVSPRL